MRKYSIDRIEGSIAVLIDDEDRIKNVPSSLLPAGSREGSILLKDGDDYILCQEETDRAKREMADLQRSIFGKKENKTVN